MMANRIDELREPLCGFFRAYSKAVYAGVADIEFVAAASRHPDGVPFEWESAAFGYKFLDAVDDLQLPPNADRIGEVSQASWEGVQKDMLLIGEIDKSFDVTSFISDEFTDCANDFDRDEVLAEIKAWMADPANAEYVKRPETQ